MQEIQAKIAGNDNCLLFTS